MGARIIFLVCGVLALALGASSARASGEPYGGPFIDRFEAFNAEHWVMSHGWSNGDWIGNDWRNAQVRMRRGGGVELVLARQRRAEKRFTSGELQTIDVYRYGYFETRMRVPRGSGMVSGFFTYTREGHDNSTWDEIDVEILGRNTRRIQLTFFQSGERRSITLPLGFDAASGYHTYGFEWSPTSIRWYVDGRMIYETTGEGVGVPQRPQRLYLNLWNSHMLTSWVGPISRGRGPWTMRVACVAHAPRYTGRPICPMRGR